MSIERPLITLSLAATGGNQIKAAQLLGLNRNRTLRSRSYAISTFRPAETYDDRSALLMQQSNNVITSTHVVWGDVPVDVEKLR